MQPITVITSAVKSNDKRACYNIIESWFFIRKLFWKKCCYKSYETVLYTSMNWYLSVSFDALILMFASLQWIPGTGPCVTEKRSQMAGHVGKLGKVDEQKIQKGKPPELIIMSVTHFVKKILNWLDGHIMNLQMVCVIYFSKYTVTISMSHLMQIGNNYE